LGWNSDWFGGLRQRICILSFPLSNRKDKLWLRFRGQKKSIPQ